MKERKTYTYILNSTQASDIERELLKQEFEILQPMNLMQLQQIGILQCPGFNPIDMSSCQAVQHIPIDTNICQATQYMPKTEPEPLPEPEPVYKEKIDVKWYELLILVTLAWAPFILGLLLRFLNS